PEAASQTIGFSSPDQRRCRSYDDPLLAALSEQQRQLRLRIYNDTSANTALLRSQRNKILHQIRTRCCDLANMALDEKVSRIEASSDSHKMFVAVRDLARKPTQQLLIQDSPGNTADAVCARKWLCARVQKYREIVHVLGIDFSRAFDTIDRAKLLKVLQQFLHDDEIRLIRLLLSDTTLSLRIGHQILQPFGSNTGTPQ
ncbi:hypothetical protein PHYSODRAFT_376366, partial [Phytophthora sojae]